MSERFASMNASALHRRSPVTPVRITSPPIAASARLAAGPASDVTTVSRVRLRK